MKTNYILPLAFFLAASSASLLHAKENKHPAVLAETALKKLKEGNAQFVAGKSKNLHSNKNWRDSLVAEQHPFAVIVGCSDSRVPTELVFDQGFGDLFIIRNAGNIIATDVIGSIEYAIAHLDCKLVVIMGHESCGAVTAALMSQENRNKEPLEVQLILNSINKGLENIKLPEPQPEKVAAGVEANVKWSVKQLRELLSKRNKIQIKDVKIVGAVYDLHKGQVNFQEK